MFGDETLMGSGLEPMSHNSVFFGFCVEGGGGFTVEPPQKKFEFSEEIVVQEDSCATFFVDAFELRKESEKLTGVGERSQFRDGASVVHLEDLHEEFDID